MQMFLQLKACEFIMEQLCASKSECLCLGGYGVGKGANHGAT